jgi:proteasome lid subunit RPN8/RPN11
VSENITANEKSPAVEFTATVVQRIRKHARGSMDKEICGVLIGGESAGLTQVDACIEGENAAGGGAHVTFTQDTWSHIYRIKDSKFPDRAIVGWYHSHPGFGIFLSEYDLFIHESFFSAPHQVAWVFDPHSDEEGCFGWVDKKIAPLSRITIRREHLEPTEEQREVTAKLVEKAGPRDEIAKKKRIGGHPARLVIASVLILLAFIAGFACCFLIFSFRLILVAAPDRAESASAPEARPAISVASPVKRASSALPVVAATSAAVLRAAEPKTGDSVAAKTGTAQ